MLLRDKGFTLIELMITIALLGILLFIAVPNFSGFVASSRLTAAKEMLISSVALARSEAIKRGERVAICRSTNGATCAGTNQTAAVGDWSDGWLIFLDIDDDQTVDANELQRVYTDVPDSVSIQFSRADIVIYEGTGLLDTPSNNDETFTIRDTGDPDIGSVIWLRQTGRLRICQNWQASTATCADN